MGQPRTQDNFQAEELGKTYKEVQQNKQNIQNRTYKTESVTPQVKGLFESQLNEFLELKICYTEKTSWLF